MTIELSSTTTENLVQTYMVANTPGYLYKHYRRMEALQELRKRYSPEELATFVEEVDTSPEASLEDVVKAYAATVALTLGDNSSAVAVVEGLRVERLAWVKRIVETWRSTFTITSKFVYRSEPKIGVKQNIRESKMTTFTFRGDGDD